MTAGLMSGCSWFEDEKKVPLPGERISVLQLQRGLEPTDVAVQGEGFIAPEAWQNEYWPQAGGYPTHAMLHVVLSDKSLEKVWSADIGDGSSDEAPLTAQPVVFEGTVYTLDTDSEVSAFDLKSGKRLWKNGIRPKFEDEEVIGGGLAASKNILYVTNGYRELIAMNPKEGGIYWRATLPSPSRAAPTILNETVYVLTVDNQLLALEAATGKRKWDYEGTAETAGLVGAASPAVNNDIVVTPLSSGELTALRVENGSVAWSDNLSPMVNTGGAASLPDIRALPVIDKDLVFGISYGGKVVAIEQRTGHRVWQRDIGGAKSPWVAGNMIFLISSDSELVSLSRDTGSLLWVKNLSDYLQEKEDQDRNSLLWYGPVLAGGRLIVTSPEGAVLEISPKDGTLIRLLNTGDAVAAPPVVAAGTLFLLHKNGTLSAWK